MGREHRFPVIPENKARMEKWFTCEDRDEDKTICSLPDSLSSLLIGKVVNQTYWIRPALFKPRPIQNFEF